jgi:DNA-binding response OmpR family regulator
MSVPRIAVVIEDDGDIRNLLEAILGQAGFVCYTAGTGVEGIEAIRTYEPILTTLDVSLPGIDGFEVARQIRSFSPTYIIMLSARDEEIDTLMGLDAGADDYLTKPFAPKELSARIRALLRRARPASPGHAHLAFGDLEIIPDEGKVVLAGRELHLTKTEFRLLCELASNPGRVFSREMLLDRVWGYGYFGDGRLVDVHVRRLRTKVEVDPANPRHVVTVRGLGYRLQA